MTKLADVLDAIWAAIRAGECPARAAVEALREPTPEAQAAIMLAMIDTASAPAICDAMIDAILNEKPE